MTESHYGDGLHAWASLATAGMAEALGGLSEMIGQKIRTTSLSAEYVNLADASALLGGPETPVTGVYLSISGAATGHMVLVYPPEIALALVDLAMGSPIGTTSDLGEMELSVLGEVGNIMGAFFLRNIVDGTGLNLKPSPPEVMTDMAGAILDPAVADLFLYTDETVVVTARFGTEQQQITGTFLVLPSPGVIIAIADSLRAA